MSTTAQQERRGSRRGLGIIAGVAGGLLLLGGTTFALWSDSALQEGGTISNGNLDVEPLGATTYWDVSPDRTDTPDVTPITGRDAHSVADVAAYSIVPGDVLEADYGFVVALEGDNLVGDLTLTLGGAAAPPAGVTFTAQAYYLDGAAWVPVGTPSTVAPGTATPISLGLFQAANQLNGSLDVGGIPVIALPDTAGATGPNIGVVLTATFDEGTTGRTSVLVETALGDVTVNLNQVRTPGVGNFG